MQSVRGRWGDIWFWENDIYVGRSLLNYGEYGPDETEMILSLAKGLCLDIGANFGVISQALETSGFTCVAFEPQPNIFEVLCKNVKGLKYNCALGATEGIGHMAIVVPDAENNYGGMAIGYRSDLGAIEVPIKTLDSFNFVDVGFMKIDVEGYEEQVLRGGIETINKYRPIMYIEDDRPENSNSLRSFITSLGYTIRIHNPALYREENFFGVRRNIWDKLYASKNLVCIPEEK